MNATPEVAAVPIDLDAIGASGGGDVETRDRRQVGGHSDPTADAAIARSASQREAIEWVAELAAAEARLVRQD